MSSKLGQSLHLTTGEDQFVKTGSMVNVQHGAQFLNHVCLLLEQARLLCDISQLNRRVFSKQQKNVGGTDAIEHSILFLQQIAQSHSVTTLTAGSRKYQELKRQVSDLLQRYVVKSAYGASLSPVELVGKKDNSRLLSIDYKRPTSVTLKDACLPPRINTFNMANWYLQVPIEQDAKKKSAFATVASCRNEQSYFLDSHQHPSRVED